MRIVGRRGHRCGRRHQRQTVKVNLQRQRQTFKVNGKLSKSIFNVNGKPSTATAIFNGNGNLQRQRQTFKVNGKPAKSTAIFNGNGKLQISRRSLRPRSPVDMRREIFVKKKLVLGLGRVGEDRQCRTRPHPRQPAAYKHPVGHVYKHMLGTC